MEEKELYGEAELGRLTLKLLIYRFKVYSAITQLIIGLTSLIIAFSLIFFSKFFSNIRVPEFIWIFIFLGFFTLFFSIAIAIDYIFRKSHRSLRYIISSKGKKIDEKRINYTYTLSFSLPYILLYMINPLPLWYSYAWLLSMNIAYFMIWILYERYINNIIPDLKLRINIFITVTLLPFSFISLYFGSINDTLAIYSAVVGVAISSIISSIQEIYRAEKTL